MNADRVSTAETLIAELNPKINSPLAAIRSALYWAACCTADPELHRYLQLANSEITSIAETLRAARQSSARRSPVVIASDAAGRCLKQGAGCSGQAKTGLPPASRLLDLQVLSS